MGLGLALLIGLFIRTAYWTELVQAPSFLAPQNDPEAFLAQARHLALVDPWGGESPFFKAPFYPYLLAFFIRLGLDPLVWARVLQMGLGLASAAIGAAIARSLGGSRTAAVVAAALLACTGTFVYFEGEILITSWIVFFDLAALLVLARARGRPPSTLRAAGAGLLLGLSAIARPTVLIFAAFVGLVPLIRAGRGRVARIAVFYFALALPIVPVALRNHLVGGDAVLISSQGGIAFYTGNNPGSDGMFGSPAGFEIIGGNWEYYDCVRHAERRIGRELRPSEVSRFYMGEGLRFWRETPAAAASLWLKKARLFWGRPRVSNNQDIDRAIEERTGGRLFRPLFDPGFDLLLIATGIAGLVWLGRRAWLLSGFVAVYSTTVITYFVATRYRVPVLAVLAPAAAIFLVDGLRVHAELARDFCARMCCRSGADGMQKSLAISAWTLRGGGKRRLVMPFAIALAAAYFLWPDTYRLDETSPAQALFARAASHQRLGRLDEAADAFQNVLELDPDYPRAWMNLGIISMERDNVREAGAAFLAELDHHPRDPLAVGNLGALLLSEERHEEAIGHFERAIELRPNYIRAYRNLSLALVALGRKAEALATLDAALGVCEVAVEYRPDEAGVRSDRAAVLAGDGRLQEAEAEYRRAIAVNPMRLEARIGLGSVLGRSGRLPEAEELLSAALAEAPDRIEARMDLGNVFAAQGRAADARREYRLAAELDLSRPEPLFALAGLAIREGRLEEGRLLLEACLERSPGFGPAERALGSLAR